MLLKRRGFAAIAVITLALGIGANTAIFSLVRAVLLRPLPFSESERLIGIRESKVGEGHDNPLAFRTFAEIRDKAQTIESVAAYVNSNPTVEQAEGTVSLQGSRVSYSYFKVLGVNPILGRDFTPEDDKPGAPLTAILSYELWQQLYGGDRDIVGKPQKIDGQMVTIIGVMGPILLLSVAGGALLSVRALRPLRGLIHTLHAIIATGALATRASVPGTEDEVAELSRLFNTMLGRISLLISGMQSTLDNVAHDLRTPMTRLRGMAEVVLHTETSETALREALANCIEESDRILTMLNTLMDISEAEHGAMRLEKEPVSACDLITQAVELYHDVADDKAIQLATSVPPELSFSADRNRMLQVLTNLLDNAIKYTACGGQVTLTATRDDQHIVLTVTDTGVGIPPEDLPHIWDRLYRGDTSRSQRGLGLGLSLVKAIVQAHHGEVAVSSQLGRGARFSLTLPLAHFS